MTPAFLRCRLGGLMFLQYFMMGVWFVPLGTYMSKGLGFDGVIGFAYGSQGIAAIISTLVIGTIADRFMAAQKVLAILFLLAGLALIALAFETHRVEWFLAIAFVHFLFFIPTIPIANAVCFHWLPRPALQFPRVRVLGTIGWIASGLLVGIIARAAESRLPLLIGGATGILLAAYALTLPDTPPRQRSPSAGLDSIIGLDVIRREADRSFWVLIGATLAIMIPMAFYYAYCNNFLVEAGSQFIMSGVRLEATAIQSLGQVSELVFLLLLPRFFRAVGIKGVFILGIASWALRYALFAAAYNGESSILWMIVIGVLLHGAANDFIQVAGQLYVDTTFSPDAKSRAQAFFTTVLMGLGAVIGSVIANMVYAAHSSSSTQHNWPAIWLIPAAFALIILIAFALTFSPRVELPRASHAEA